EVLETKLEVGVDRRAPYGPEERKEQFDAAMRVHALFGRMSTLVDRIEGARSKAEASGKEAPEGSAAKARALATRLEDLRKRMGGTREGGAITGEERLREHADILYGAIQSWEGRPARYQLERIDALSRQLDDVARDLDAALGGT